MNPYHCVRTCVYVCVCMGVNAQLIAFQAELKLIAILAGQCSQARDWWAALALGSIDGIVTARFYCQKTSYIYFIIIEYIESSK